MSPLRLKPHREEFGEEVNEVLRKVGGNYNPDFGDRDCMSFDDEPAQSTRNWNFLSELVFDNTKNEKASRVLSELKVRRHIVKCIVNHPHKSLITKNNNILKRYVDKKLREIAKELQAMSISERKSTGMLTCLDCTLILCKSYL